MNAFKSTGGSERAWKGETETDCLGGWTQGNQGCRTERIDIDQSLQRPAANQNVL